LITHTAGLGYWFWNSDIDRCEHVTGTPNIITGSDAVFTGDHPFATAAVIEGKRSPGASALEAGRRTATYLLRFRLFNALQFPLSRPIAA